MSVQHVGLAAEAGKGYRITNSGLVISGEMSHEEWAALGQRLALYANAVSWAIGDWVIYGQDREWGATSRFREAMAHTERTYESVLQAASVARAFPPESRRVDVSWSHHREALRLPKRLRQMGIETAAREKWSKRMFAEYIDDVQERMQAGEGLAEPDGTTRAVAFSDLPSRTKVKTRGPRPTITCPSCGHRWVTTREGEEYIR